MNKTAAVVNLFAVFFVLAISERWSTTRFVLSADAWVCIPTSTTSRESANTAKTKLKSRAREFKFKLPSAKFLSSPVVSWLGPKHGSVSSLLSSSSQPFFDKTSISAASFTNCTYDSPSTTSPTSSIKIKETNSDSKPNNLNPSNDLIFIRPALFVDMDRASKILADGFFKGPKTNWITYQYEKFITYLSLESNFPRTQQQRSRYELYVACCVTTGETWGFVEIDARGATGERTSKVYEKTGGSPYMCNLAIDEKHQRKGIATSLVYECERQVKEWYSDDESRRKKKDEENVDRDILYNSNNEMTNRILSKTKNVMSDSICLKVRESNKAAVQMYSKLGYVTVFEEIEDPKTGENIFLMRKDLRSLLPSLSPSPAAELASE